MKTYGNTTVRDDFKAPKKDLEKFKEIMSEDNYKLLIKNHATRGATKTNKKSGRGKKV